MKSNSCSCNGAAEVCRTTAGERPRYFPRQLVTAEDMMMEQEYFRNRMRLHNRLLHGWGVVCGLQVAPVPKKDGSGMEPWLVQVCPGDALGPYGDDIMVPREVEIDLRQDSVSGSSIEPCGTIGDVWCSEVWTKRKAEEYLYLAIKYAEIPTRPVRVQPAGCGCDDTACEHSRLRDGYVIKVMPEDDYRELIQNQPRSPDWRALFQSPIFSPASAAAPNPACWCPEHPWIVLACLQVDPAGKILLIDNCGPRRLVAALGGFYWSCANVKIAGINNIDSPPVGFECGNPNSRIALVRGSNELYIFGEGFQAYPKKVDMGPGITATVDQATFSPVKFRVTAQVAATEAEAPQGPRDVIVVNPDCSTAICLGALLVPAGQRAQPLHAPAEMKFNVEAEKASEAKSKRKKAVEA